MKVLALFASIRALITMSGETMKSKLAALTVAIVTMSAYMPVQAVSPLPPPVPNWHTDPTACAWHWKVGGGIGLWVESCKLSTGNWEVRWSEEVYAFVVLFNGQVQQVAVQSWPFSNEGGIEKLRQSLIQAGQLTESAACQFVPAHIRPAPRTMMFFTLSPKDPNAMKPTSTGEVPDPQCGPFGASTHGVRYFMTDLRWPDRAIFIEEGQDRPMFDPRSITVLH